MPDQSLTGEFDLTGDFTGVIVAPMGNLYENYTKYTYLGARVAPGLKYGRGLITVKNDETGHVFDTTPAGFNMRLVRNHRERYNPAGTHDLGNTGIPYPGTVTVDNTDIQNTEVKAVVTVTYPADPHTSRTTGTFWNPGSFGEFVFSHVHSGANLDIEFILDRS